MATKSKKLVTFRELANQYGKDPSYIAKMVKEVGLLVIEAVNKEGKACKTILAKDKAKLEQKMPLLTTLPLGSNEHEVNAIAAERGQDVSGLRKLLIRKGFNLLKRRLEVGGKGVNALSDADYKRFMKENPVRVTA